MLLNLFYTLYVVSYRPLHGQWTFEVFNELSTLLLSTILFSFTDTVSEPTFKYYISGYAFIGIFGMNVAVNMLCILYQAIRTLVKNVRYKVRLCKYQREKRNLKYEIELKNQNKVVSQKTRSKNPFIKLNLTNADGSESKREKNLFII